MTRFTASAAALCILLSNAHETGAGDTPHGVAFGEHIVPFLNSHCMDCHSADAAEGDIVLEGIDGITSENVELWKQVWEQVALRQMPPREAEEHPRPLDRLRFSDQITAQIEVAMRDAGGFNRHRHPSKGNHIDHSLLFGPLPDDLKPTSTPARLWRIHPMEHLSRLSSLINLDPEYDSKRPGLRARGDFVNPNKEGEIKVYFGLDRVIGWVGGTAAYAASITGFPPPLSLEDSHGLRSYPNLYSVNGAEATQIATTAEDILRFMAFGPDAEPYQFAKSVKDIDEKYKHESLRGLAQSLFYGLDPKRPLTPVYDLAVSENPTSAEQQAAVEFLFTSLTGRPPTDAEASRYTEILTAAMDDLGQKDGLILGLTPIFLDREALFRSELAATGQPDAHGRVMLQDTELALAINSAFCYHRPDEQLLQAARDENLRSRADVEREVDRILADDSIRKPRLLQFFREYFDYDRAGSICKDNAALHLAGGDTRVDQHYRAMWAMTANTDRLIELILSEDQDVLKELLTTDRVVASVKEDAPYFGQYISDERPKKDPKAKRGPNRRVTIEPYEIPKGSTVHVRVARVVKPLRTQRTLTTLPTAQRKGILTHPVWLVAHSDAVDNHAILRGRWIRERLLGDAVPDVPITVDAMLPDEPEHTLRHRMRVTREEYCWKCHQKMDPLGLPFEMYNHIGLYRTTEKKKPVVTTGEIIDSGDQSLDGPVKDALELIDRLAASERVEQVFVRHAFRFWIGRNETIDDAPVLQDAWRAYRTGGGSMKALLKSLMLSDAWLYRKVERESIAGSSVR